MRTALVSGWWTETRACQAHLSLCQLKCKSEVGRSNRCWACSFESCLVVHSVSPIKLRWFSLDDSNHVWCVQSLHVISSIETYSQTTSESRIRLAFGGKKWNVCNVSTPPGVPSYVVTSKKKKLRRHILWPKPH